MIQKTRYLTKNIPVVTGDATNGSGQITLNCENNSHGVKIKGPPHSAAADYTLTLPNDDGTSSQVLATNGTGVGIMLAHQLLMLAILIPAQINLILVVKQIRLKTVNTSLAAKILLQILLVLLLLVYLQLLQPLAVLIPLN
jgi:hypothetical protein